MTATAPVVGGARASRARPAASAAERLERRRRLTGFSMALPPVVIIALFVGFPVLLAIGFSFGMTGGLNSTSAAIGQNVHEADDRLEFRLRSFPGEPSHTLVDLGKPKGVRVNGGSLQELAEPARRNPGWWWDGERRRLYLTVPHPNEAVEVVIQR